MNILNRLINVRLVIVILDLKFWLFKNVGMCMVINVSWNLYIKKFVISN